MPSSHTYTHTRTRTHTSPSNTYTHNPTCFSLPDLEPLAVARLLKAVADREAPLDLLLMGKQAIDGDNNQTVS